MSLVSEVLFDYQVEAANKIAEQKAVLLADQPGLGKTLEVLGALEIKGLFDYSEAMILILTPIINAQTTWIDSIERFVKPRVDVNVIDISKGSGAQKAKQFDKPRADAPTFIVANHDALSRVEVLKDFVYDAVIVDESHLVLPITGNSDTKFWKSLGKLQMYNEGCLRIAISGTPDRGKLENRFGTWRFLYPHIVGSNKFKWQEKHFFMVEQKVARDRTIKVPYRLKDEREWNLYSEKWMIRRTKHEVLPQLPPKRYVDVVLPLSDECRGHYSIAFLDYQAALREDADTNSAAMVFALRSRQRATCMWDEDFQPVVGGASTKLEWLVEWLRERGFIEQDSMADNDAKVVIVSQFSKVLHWLKKELANVGVAADVLDGGVSTNERVRIQQDFQLGGLRVVLLSGTMGVGINLDRADDLIMVDSPYDPDKIEQIEDRVHRASNLHNVTIWNLVAKDTIDEAIAEKVSKRYTLTRKLMDGSRGIDFEREFVSNWKGQ